MEWFTGSGATIHYPPRTFSFAVKVIFAPLYLVPGLEIITESFLKIPAGYSYAMIAMTNESPSSLPIVFWVVLKHVRPLPNLYNTNFFY